MLRRCMVLFLLALASCAVAPYSGQEVDSSIIAFDGFVDEPSATVRLEAFDVITDDFVPKGTARSATTASLRAGALCPNSPALYRYQGSVNLNWPSYWRWLGNSEYEARLRAIHVNAVGERPIVFTDNPNAGSCMAQRAKGNCDFYNIASQCGFKLDEAKVYGSGAPWNP